MVRNAAVPVHAGNPEAAVPAARERRPAIPPMPPAARKAISGGLRESRLLFPDDGSVRVKEVWQASAVGDGAALSEIRAHLAALEEVLRPADPGRLLRRILVLLSHFPAREHQEGVEFGMALDWAEDLSDYPMWAVEEACRRWRRTRRFRPQISEFVALCEEEAGDLIRRMRRLKEVVAASAAAASPYDAAMRSLARATFRRGQVSVRGKEH